MIITLKYGNTNTYYTGGLLIDTDMPGTLPSLRRALKAQGLTQGDVRYVLATHWHPDHVGLIGELTQGGAQLLLPDWQLPYVHSSDAIFARDRRCGFVPVDERRARVICAGDSRAFLASLGIAGELVRTTGHSPDGAALLLDDGNALVGDLEPLAFLDGYDDNPALRADWDSLLRGGARVILYGHANRQVLAPGAR